MNNSSTKSRKTYVTAAKTSRISWIYASKTWAR
jgi:hypothetical protein